MSDQISKAAFKAWQNSLKMHIPFFEWLEAEKLAGKYWGA